MANLYLNDKKNYVNPSYRRSDHPSFKEKRHTMVVDSQGASNRDVQTESGTLRFENGVAVLPDDGRARDIVQEMNATGKANHPNQYALLEKRPTVNVDIGTHPMRVTSPGMPWATYDELGRRVKTLQEDQDVKTDQPLTSFGRGPN